MKYIYLTFLSLVFSPYCALALPAFPGAMGMGADTVGGRGGTVYIVNTLSDVVDANDGLTSLREAVEASEPRIVVFAVSGHIVLKDVLTIKNPYITIAGQTSPGGIAIVGERTRIYKTHDVVIRHVRFRVGYSQATTPNEDQYMENLQIWGDPNQYASTDPQNHSYNIVIDHCSFAYGIDESFETAYTVYDVTFSHNMIGKQWKNPTVQVPQGAEGNHDYGSLLWGKYTALPPRITMLGNVYISNTSRQPEMNYRGFVDMQNNIAYDHYGGNSPGFYSQPGGYEVSGNFINNYTLGGPQSNSQYGTISGSTENNTASMYTSGNTGCTIPGASPNWCVGTGWQQTLLDSSIRSSTPFPTTGVAVSTSPITTKAAALTLVKAAGATVPVQDSIDLELINCFANETNCTQNGAVPYPSGWPRYENVTPPIDSDKDGMADDWEVSQNGDLSLTPSGLTIDNNYTNIELYINSLTNSATGALISPPAIKSITTN